MTSHWLRAADGQMPGPEDAGPAGSGERSTKAKDVVRLALLHLYD